MQDTLTQSMVLPRLWIYTNYDCNLRCTYCLSYSYPGAERKAVPLEAFQRLIDEAREAGLQEVYLTGGEPFLLPDIFDRIAYAGARLPVTVLTNGMLLQGRRLERLLALREFPITLQVSLDGHEPELHDAYRGRGSWKRTVASIRRLRELGFRVAIGATETPVNTHALPELTRFVADLGIDERDFFVRPLTKRGFSQEGIELAAADLVPELTLTRDGVFWHPQAGGEAWLLSRDLSPLAAALHVLQATYAAVLAGGPRPQRYRCA
jgi:MoaA/NifB/PqqE/SkfB family radical SAM enzyme